MARKKSDMTDVSSDVPDGEIGCEPAHFVLARNHGLVVVGRACQFYPAGTVLDAETDAELISQLVKSGAQFR